MKSMKPLDALAIMLGVISLFLGFVVISVGIGAVVPAVYKISAPIVCWGLIMEVDRSSTTPLPGQMYFPVSVSCLAKEYVSQQETIYAIIVSGFLYSLLIFVPSFFWFIDHPDFWGMAIDENGVIVWKRKNKKEFQ